MPQVSVSVQLYGAVVEHRVLQVRDSVRIGEAETAQVAFPGADILVVRHGDRIRLRSWWLEAGEAAAMSLGPVQVELEVLRSPPTREWPGWMPDVRLFVATAAIVLISAWAETVQLYVERNPLLAADLHALAQLPAVDVARAALRRPHEPDGPGGDGYGDPPVEVGSHQRAHPVTYLSE
jgi:hypothetical protein